MGFFVPQRFQLTRSRGAWLVYRAISNAKKHFNSHAHVERDAFEPGQMLLSLDFNSHAHVERDCGCVAICSNYVWFQLTRSRGAWLNLWNDFKNPFEFQLTRSRGAWRQFSEIVYIITYFNSHAHVERDMLSGHFKTLPIISTHTLTWSVTVRPVINPVSNWISTHTLTWSVTSVKQMLDLCLSISTHTLTWSVTRRSKTKEVKNMISTHTLTWSVTVRHAIESREEWFQLTRSRGAWPLSDYTPLCDFIFQLTRSRGAWLVFNRPPEFTVNFNSHAHVERDRWLQAPERLFGISTHTLTWSVTAVHGP